MSPRAPRVSIGLPVYNGERFVGEAISSILAQDFEDIELVVSDNCSTDATPDICSDFAAADSRVKFIRQPENLGAAKNYNVVFAESSGDFFKWAAHDDAIRPGFVSACLDRFDQEASQGRRPAVVYPGSVFIDETGAEMDTDSARMHTLSRWPAVRVFHALQTLNLAAPVFGIMPRTMLEKTRLIDSFVSSDYVLLVEIAMLGTIVQIDDILFLRRIHPGMSRLANRSRKDVLRWFDPNARSHLSERQRLFLEYMRSATTLRDVNLAGRVACGAAVLTGVPFRRAHVLGGRAKQGLRRWLQARPSARVED